MGHAVLKEVNVLRVFKTKSGRKWIIVTPTKVIILRPSPAKKTKHL